LKYFKRLGFFVSVFWAYVLISALYILEYPAVPYGQLNIAFMASAGQTLAECIIIPFCIMNLSKRTFISIFNVFICIELFLLWKNGYGLMVAPSFDTAVIACFMPFMWFILMPIALITILTHHGSTAIVILIAQIVAYTLKKKPILLLAVPVLIGSAYLHTKGKFFDSMERIHTWQFFMQKWWAEGWKIRLFGFHPGSFMWISLLLNRDPTYIYLQLHNDWLQILFELGFIGLGLAIGVFVSAVVKVWNDPKLLAAVFGCGAFACTYHPLRFFPSMVLVTFIFWNALKTARP